MVVPVEPDVPVENEPPEPLALTLPPPEPEPAPTSSAGGSGWGSKMHPPTKIGSTQWMGHGRATTVQRVHDACPVREQKSGLSSHEAGTSRHTARTRRPAARASGPVRAGALAC
jgi:hypothetical protein